MTGEPLHILTLLALCCPQAAHDRARAVLEAHVEELHLLAGQLLLHETLTGAQIRDLLAPGARAAAAAAAKAAHANDDSSPAAQEVISTLRTGKGMLKMRDGKAARGHFERALVLCRDPASGLETPWKAERKALRGLGAAAQLLGEQDAALALMKQVLDLSEKMGDTSGVADALGVIADIYTESAWRNRLRACGPGEASAARECAR